MSFEFEKCNLPYIHQTILYRHKKKKSSAGKKTLAYNVKGAEKLTGYS